MNVKLESTELSEEIVLYGDKRRFAFVASFSTHKLLRQIIDTLEKTKDAYHRDSKILICEDIIIRRTLRKVAKSSGDKAVADLDEYMIAFPLGSLPMLERRRNATIERDEQ